VKIFLDAVLFSFSGQNMCGFPKIIYSLRIFLYEFQVLVTQQIDLMTAKAWLSADKQLERKVGYLVRKMIALGCV